MATPSISTATVLRQSLSQALGLPAEQIPLEANLIEWGLDSVTLIRLAGQWRRQGLAARFADLIADPRLSAWLARLDTAPQATAPDTAPSGDDGLPFELAPMQHAYWVGRAPGQQLGGVAAHFYNEFDGHGIDPIRLEAAVRSLLERHAMLRAQFCEDGRQRILAQSPWSGLKVHDLRQSSDEQAQQQLQALRADLSHRQLAVEQGQVLDIQLSLLPDTLRPGGTRLHLNLDMLAADALSLRTLLGDLVQLYRQQPLPPLDYSFARYLAQLRREQTGSEYRTRHQQDRDYWLQRLEQLPGAPRLPIKAHSNDDSQVRRRHHWLSPSQRQAFERHARDNTVTPAMALAAVFCEALGAWSDTPELLLNLPLFNRTPLHSDVDRLVGDFTSSILLAWDGHSAGTFAVRAKALQRRFHEDAAHSAFSGLEVLRELSRQQGEQVLAPVVYTSALGLGELFADGVQESFGRPAWIISQGPQVWLDAQVTELDGGLLVNLDAREGLFADGVLDGLFEAYTGLLQRLCAEASAWHQAPPALIPPSQLSVRQRCQGLPAPLPVTRLHEAFFAQARMTPESPALLHGDHEVISYGAVAHRALQLAAQLETQGVRPGDVVALQLPKGPEQVIAVLGILACSATYLPIGVDQPLARRQKICDSSGAKLLLSELPAAGEALRGPRPGQVSDLAYILYTSGSTGEPKGVEISHLAAANTLQDLQRRLNLEPHDRILALSALEFDLSVFDLFAALSTGAAVICIEPQAQRDAERWRALALQHRASVLNCVPALLDMLLSCAPHQARLPLRAVLLGGDKVAPDLAPRLWAQAPGCRFLALGGATETAIHSTLFEVLPGQPLHWHCLPYGKPLDNVSLRIVDRHGHDCPDWVAGELWIGGAGVAQGYRGDPLRSAERFVEYQGLRWYRTGDSSRYHPDGNVEFLGRSDFQLKLRGYRIEAGEIENALVAWPGIEHAVVLLAGQQLAAVVRLHNGPVEPAYVDLPGLSQHLAERLPAYMIPEHILGCAQLPLTGNGKIDRKALQQLLAAQSPGPRAELSPPCGPIEQQVARAWQDLLGCSDVCREHNFFSLGGDSLSATRLVRLLSEQGLSQARVAQVFAKPVLAQFCAGLHRDTEAVTRRTIVADLPQRHAAFPMTEVQQAYWLGRDPSLVLGGVSCHFYREYEVQDLDLPRLQRALERLIVRHEMLRAVFDQQGQARILQQVPPFVIGQDHSSLEELRERCAHRVFNPGQWPLFDVQAFVHGRHTRLAISLDNLILDALSILRFYSELDALYRDPTLEPAPLELSFRDYQLQCAPEPAEWEAAQRFWQERLPELPPHPQLPLAADPASLGRPRFERLQGQIGAGPWQAILGKAQHHGLTASAVLLCAFAETLGRWSTRPDLSLNLTLFDRRPLHPQIDQVMGDFTSLTLLGYTPLVGDRWLDRARRTQQALGEALEHRCLGSVSLLRQLARGNDQQQASMPVVFTSALGVPDGTAAPQDGPFAHQVFGLTQTPQVWLDHQVVEADGGIALNWDRVVGLFPEGMVEAMFQAYLHSLNWLAEHPWDSAPPDLLPLAQAQQRARINAPGPGVPGDPTLHQGFFQQAHQAPQNTALLWGEHGALSYGELAERALRIARCLSDAGVMPGDLVAVSLAKGPQQVASVLGVLAAGAAYLPVGVDQPLQRCQRIVQQAGVVLMIAEQDPQLPGLKHLKPAQALQAQPLPAPRPVAADALAYVIYTSGSTGQPKGVEITHRAAMNTVAEINRCYAINATDRGLALSALDFDLSVYDLFGLLSVGAALVLIDESQRRDARAWLKALQQHGVTLWNSVPALLDMLLEANAHDRQPLALRVALLSGDWIGLDLPARLAQQAPDCRFIALGGATEAAIWSNHFEVRQALPGWRSIPYGLPLANQAYRVVDALGRDCPDWVTGELWIGGAGVARGYRHAPQLSAERFVEGWYRTGDLGRYHPDGLLEFLGRADSQVKIRGHRIELGEIEAALVRHPAVTMAVAVVAAQNRLMAAVTATESAPALARHLEQCLPAYMRPEQLLVLERLPLSSNGKVDRRALLRTLEASALPPCALDEQPLSANEQLIAGLWQQLLNVQGVSRHDNFFRLGGDSLLATRFLEMLRTRLGVDLPMGQLFGAATLMEVAQTLDRQPTPDTVEEGVI
ncbi:non-ribosomal peptide synthetase [Pseudomonas fluorescens]|uniref:Amino acid adenylation domain-containing protein n=1 Tax=Pseudomonas fluorescens TaxID=294 RepID=A0A944HBH8_PSEFL|nr:non-ribosomal peptide synthetase [Pseudomonas fluorescens]MBT2297503.1 amino acid adenylation domain-containing protein [Pseudomonas fluorescens]MBT2305701.1 amino acid adenylation domain-containing protein [Pseudomonas fluorescens]MBT2314276.1 amino acid adenylation domain-containing protein [Pseudomonas fluorescens]MBT2319232.1 amino acid adenylation domain-containing protein [Pseudomonas fluorescens]MBT2328495.1 amino acid adenylation domain-containing protein [Pseudomonas fluorescens]